MPRKTGEKRAKPSRRGVRYSQKKKASLLQKYKSLRRTGLTAMQAAGKIRVSYITLLRWQKEIGKSTQEPPRAKQASKRDILKTLKQAVTIPRGLKTEAEVRIPKDGLTLVTPTGYRIEGISTQDLIGVLDELR